MKENIERLFLEEVREKKKVGYGAYHKAGKGVLSKSNQALRTPYFFMKEKERKMLSGAVETKYEVLTWEQWSKTDRDTQRTLLTKWRELYPNKEIMKTLEIGRVKKLNSQSFADIVNELGCPVKRELSASEKKRKSKAFAMSLPKKMMNSQLELEVGKAKTESTRIEPLKIATPVINGLHLEYNGDFDQEQLTKIFTKLQLLIDGEPNKFKINLCLTEVE